LFVVALISYFAVAVTVAAMLLLPPIRASILNAVADLHGRVSRRASNSAARARGHLTKSVKTSQSILVDTQKLLFRRRLLILITAGILATPPLIAIALRGRQLLFQYDDTTRVPDEKIAALLNGEQLVPPPQLPPEVFATQEVEQARPALQDASRDWNLLDADFRTRLLLVYKIMREQYGYQMALLEGYRSPERQNRLSKLGGVTNAAAFQSYHQYGLAADNAFLRDGKLVISEKDPWAMRGYQLYGQTAEQCGLVWGGRWKLMDLGHVEYHKPGFVMGKSPVPPQLQNIENRAGLRQ
jgi:peptidoglycan LD-endopeptidase CwlK